MQTLLIIDDEKNVLYSLEKGLQVDGYTILTADTARKGIELAENINPAAVLLDVRLPDMSGLEAFDRLRATDPQLPVIIMTAHGTTETAIEAMKRGAYDYLIKPLRLHELRQIVSSAMEVSRLSRVPAVYEEGDATQGSVDRIVGSGAAMHQVYKSIGRVAGQDVNVLVLGESGTGKELVARAIFQHSTRSKDPFLAINAAAIPEALLESELFGHEKGAFTGADRKRIGKFEQADRGTLFLDEIGDMPLPTQAKVLRVLQDGRFERVGGNETIQTDVRVIAATNRNLEGLIAEGQFRQDLFYRLKVFSIELPPLRERLDDLPELLDHFVRVYNRELGKQVQTIAPSVIAMLGEHRWPGNVRELQSAVKYALVHSHGSVLTPECFPASCRIGGGESPLFEQGGEIAEAESPRASVLDISKLFATLVEQKHANAYHAVGDVVDRFLLTEALQRAQGNQVEASRLLGISRTTLRAKLENLGISIEKQVQSNNVQGDRKLDS